MIAEHEAALVAYLPYRPKCNDLLADPRGWVPDMKFCSLTGRAINAIGNAHINVLIGNEGVSSLTGAAGNDGLIGGQGNGALKPVTVRIGIFSQRAVGDALADESVPFESESLNAGLAGAGVREPMTWLDSGRRDRSASLRGGHHTQ